MQRETSDGALCSGAGSFGFSNLLGACGGSPPKVIPDGPDARIEAHVGTRLEPSQ